ncbi:hypothetical protein SAMN05428939_1676 [Streptomyces sp. TLI_105]|nr:hypothetical protein SAMN05428939_1676 [Streptomyces sp. TLI_105]
MDDYPPIADHGLVDDLQTAALVASDGTVDWWCAPRFDSPGLFASLLDSDRGGHCRLAADFVGEQGAVRQLYMPDTPILITRFMAPQGVGEVIDFMEPIASRVPAATHRLIPSPEGLRGSEGTFSLCSFLYVEALARSGRVHRARYAFDKMLTYADHVGLFAEEIGPSGEQLGNFPQAFTHLALVAAALALGEELDRADRTSA